MPLRLTDKLEIYIFMTGAIVFYMIDENDKRRVRCSNSDRALRRFDPLMEWGAQDLKAGAFGAPTSDRGNCHQKNTITDNSPMTARQSKFPKQAFRRKRTADRWLNEGRLGGAWRPKNRIGGLGWRRRWV